MLVGKRHHNFRDITGLRFGMLTAIAPSFSDGKKWRWRYQCDCGNETVKNASDVTKDARKGRTPNCGCHTSTVMGRQNITHGMSRHSGYGIWRSMLARCYRRSHEAWKNYGGRGIEVCERWTQSFEAFWADMGPTYEPGLTLDRRDNDGNYTPENCRWATYKVQANNRRGNAPINFSDLARETGIARSTLSYRHSRGLPLTAPVDKRKATRSTTSSTPALGIGSSS
jgi:hypothetical protein